MKLIVAGGRKYADYEHVKLALDHIHAFQGPITQIVCGMCSAEGVLTYKKDLGDGRALRVFGADGLGYRWGDENGIHVEEMPADWVRFKRAAGPLRNAKMADYADALIAFPGASGTSDMVYRAKMRGLILFDRRDL